MVLDETNYESQQLWVVMFLCVSLLGGYFVGLVTVFFCDEFTDISFFFFLNNVKKKKMTLLSSCCSRIYL